MKKPITLITCAALCIAATTAVSQDMKPMPTVKPAKHQIAPTFDPTSVSMERWMESTTTGPEHKMLGKLIGEWDVVQKLWTGDPEPSISKLRSSTKWILGGKHIQNTLKGEFMGHPYEGVGITSYDNYNERYSFFWADSMSTASYTAHGFATQDGGAIEAFGQMDDAMMDMRGKTLRYTLRAVSDDKHIFQIHDLTANDEHSLVMQYTYTRR